MANALSNSLVSSTRPGSDLMGVSGRGARRDDRRTGRPGELPWPERPQDLRPRTGVGGGLGASDMGEGNSHPSASS